MSTDNLLRFPTKLTRTAKRRQDRVEIKAEHDWFVRHDHEWCGVETSGRVYLDHMQEMINRAIRQHLGVNEPSLAKMRKRITDGRNRIETRLRIKAWMISQGAKDADLLNSETALAYVFDQLQVHGTDRDEVEDRQHADRSESEAHVHDAQLQTMLTAFIRKELGASPVTPKLSFVKLAPKPSDRAEIDRVI